MKKNGLVILIAVIVLLVVIGISSYNAVIRTDEQVKSAYSTIDVQLQRRNDLVPNLVETVKGYAAHETEALDKVTAARAQMAGATTPAEAAEADANLSAALSRLLVVVENYPDLKANQNFMQLSDELAGTENRISVARRDYNTAAQTLNAKIRTFPTSIFANMASVSPAPYFEAAEADKAVPNVAF